MLRTNHAMCYFDPHKIISSLVMPLMDASKRLREYIVGISLNDAPVRVAQWLNVSLRPCMVSASR